MRHMRTILADTHARHTNAEMEKTMALGEILQIFLKIYQTVISEKNQQ